jgi:two-component system, cell cycle response regulator
MKFLVAAAEPGLSLMLEQLALRWDGEVTAVDDGAAAWRRLEAVDEPQVVFADAALPTIDGARLCERLRLTPRGQRCYFILVASSLEGLDLERVTQAGVDDLITRPFEPALLDLRMRVAHTILSLREEAQAAAQAVRAQATRDPLTGALNRPAIFRMIERELSRASRDATPLAVLSVLVDDFRRITDWHGRDTGDEVLAEASRRVQRLLRPYDGLGRDGDDQLVVVLPMCDGARAAGVAARIRNHIGTEPIQTQVRAFSVTVSVGVALAGSAAEHPVEDVGRAAQSAAERARDAGGNRVETTQSAETAGS